MTKAESVKIRLNGIYIEQVKILECLQNIMTILDGVEEILEEQEQKTEKRRCGCT